MGALVRVVNLRHHRGDLRPGRDRQIGPGRGLAFRFKSILVLIGRFAKLLHRELLRLAVRIRRAGYVRGKHGVTRSAVGVLALQHKTNLVLGLQTGPGFECHQRVRLCQDIACHRRQGCRVPGRGVHALSGACSMSGLRPLAIPERRFRHQETSEDQYFKPDDHAVHPDLAPGHTVTKILGVRPPKYAPYHDMGQAAGIGKAGLILVVLHGSDQLPMYGLMCLNLDSSLTEGHGIRTHM